MLLPALTDYKPNRSLKNFPYSHAKYVALQLYVPVLLPIFLHKITVTA